MTADFVALQSFDINNIKTREVVTQKLKLILNVPSSNCNIGKIQHIYDLCTKKSQILGETLLPLAGIDTHLSNLE